MVTLLVENGIWFDLTLFGPRTAARCASFPSAASYTGRASAAHCASLRPTARCARRTFGPTTPASSLCYCLCRSYLIANFRQRLIESRDKLLLDPLQSLSLAKDRSNTLHHIFQSVSSCHADLL
jgi:hypothetical protein